MLGTPPSLLMENQGAVNSLPVVCCYARGWVYGEIVSHPLLPILMLYFSHLPSCVGDPQLLSGFLSEGIVSYIAVETLYPWEEVNSGSYVAILYWNPYYTLMISNLFGIYFIAGCEVGI